MVYVMCILFMFSQILSQNTVVAIAKGEKKVAISQIQDVNSNIELIDYDRISENEKKEQKEIKRNAKEELNNDKCVTFIDTEQGNVNPDKVIEFMDLDSKISIEYSDDIAKTNKERIIATAVSTNSQGELIISNCFDLDDEISDVKKIAEDFSEDVLSLQETYDDKTISDKLYQLQGIEQEDTHAYRVYNRYYKTFSWLGNTYQVSVTENCKIRRKNKNAYMSIWDVKGNNQTVGSEKFQIAQLFTRYSVDGYGAERILSHAPEGDRADGKLSLSLSSDGTGTATWDMEVKEMDIIDHSNYCNNYARWEFRYRKKSNAAKGSVGGKNSLQPGARFKNTKGNFGVQISDQINVICAANGFYGQAAGSISTGVTTVCVVDRK